MNTIYKKTITAAVEMEVAAVEVLQEVLLIGWGQHGTLP
jgi:hypothetical protein